jgi:Fur family ferric uptake transcriptional regulator
MGNQYPINDRIRMTPQRRLILDELRRCMTHPTAREVYDRVRVRLPRISLATVYRNLDSLSRQGIIRRMELGSAERRYDGDLDDHYHILCTQCGRIADAPIERLRGLEDTLARASGYTVLGHWIEFKGICPDCRASTGTSRAEGGCSEMECPDEGITHG